MLPCPKIRISNTVISVTLPEQTVIYGYDKELQSQVIRFSESGVALYRPVHGGRKGEWIADIYGKLARVQSVNPDITQFFNPVNFIKP